MKRLKILFVFMLLGTLFVFQISGNVVAVSGTAITYIKGNDETGTITTQDTTYKAGSNISIDASNQISAVLPVIKVDSSTGAITDSSGKSMNVSIFSLTSGVTASAAQVSTLANEATGTYMLSLDGYIPKVATVKESKGEKSYS